jgi:peroxiredoxin family protein/TusA-related sulfurtransferase/rhodanese-related sulfurtransferase
MVPLAGPANKQGRIVANNILGDYKEEYKGTQGTSIAKIFDLTVGNTGTNEKTLNKIGKEYKKDYLISLIHANSHAGYYPGGLPLSIKLIYDMEGKILGSQIVGYDGVDKRIDVIATAIRFGGTVDDLIELELAYAPPYSSAKDPVNMVGFAADNLLKGLTDQILWRELNEIELNDVILLDTREDIEISVGSIPNSVHIPLSSLRNRLGELDMSKLIIPYCSIGLRGYIADRILKSKGFKSMNLAGGFKTYKTLYMKEDGSQDSGVPFNDSGVTEIVDSSDNIAEGEFIKLNACGLSCPGPITQVSEKMKTLNNGDVLEISVTDPGFLNDIKAWCKNTCNVFISDRKEDKNWVVLVKKGSDSGTSERVEITNKKGKTIVVFSGDLDKAIASFIIANGARSMGDEVNMFFTFWGLNIIRKHERIKVKKDFMSTMFSKMMPRGSQKLGISKMNFAGMGGKMIRKVMNNKNIYSLEELMEQALKSGIKLTACQMSMDVMGITQEELIDGVQIGGVAMMLSNANESNASFFI